jgi:long-chain-fatty-acid---luciferin-component ligase
MDAMDMGARMIAPAAQRLVPIERSPTLDPLDLLISEEGMFQLSQSRIVETRWRVLRAALEWHLRTGTPYAGYAARLDFGLDLLASPGALDRVPVIPSMLFKRAGVAVKHPESGSTLLTTSSGTQGGISQIPRDDLTLRRFFASIGNLSNEMLEIENPSLRVFNLGPDVKEAPHLWIAYVMAGVSAMLPHGRHYVEGDTFLLEELLRDLRKLEGERIVVIGPPPILHDLSRAMAARDQRASVAPDSVITTIGGWKRRAGERIERGRFNAGLAEVFGLSPAQVRDTFNMVELNTVLMECREQRFHVPPWLYVRARSPATLAVLPPGESGVLGYLDPTARSYPGFILSDDLGTVEESASCACGRRSDIVRLERRLNTMESRGCALKMDAFRVS